MNRNDFLNMIEDTVPVNRQMIGEVYELIDIFPYFQSAHMLLLKGLHSNEDVKFENQLRNSAIHVGDREVLYWLLKTKTSYKSEQIDAKQDIDLKQVIVSDTQQTVIESAKNSEFMINEIEKDTDETKLSEMPDTMNQATGHSIMIAAEPDNIEPAGVIFLLDDETVPSEDKVFFMDPGFSLPELTDLLELDLDEDESRSSSKRSVSSGSEKPGSIKKTISSAGTVSSSRRNITPAGSILSGSAAIIIEWPVAWFIVSGISLNLVSSVSFSISFIINSLFFADSITVC